MNFATKLGVNNRDCSDRNNNRKASGRGAQLPDMRRSHGRIEQAPGALQSAGKAYAGVGYQVGAAVGAEGEVMIIKLPFPAASLFP
ncbi:hypothetical protein, partial [Rhodoferax ferrireducens]|uniref:hypothetical protein n=1 Tax=Rhodoferax ferrireducens TaxID=192843 RepID=UPI001E34144D